MKTLDQLFPQALIQAIGYTILHSLWQGVFIALSLTVLLIFLHRQTALTRYRAALGALLLQLLFSGLTFGYYFQAANSAGQALTNAQIKASFIFQPITQSAAYFSWANISLFFQAQLPLIVTVWFVGLAVMLVRFVGGLAYLQRLRIYKNTPLPAAWEQKLQILSTQLQLSRPVGGAESAMVKTPLVIGYFKPLILLPLGTLSNLPLNQVEAILAHELAHIRRHDYIVNILQNLIEALFFYHPAIWWVSDFVRVERENCCDDQAIAICGNKIAYAQALTNLAEIERSTPNLALALAGKDGSVLGRIKRLFRPNTVKPTFTESLVAAAIMLLFLTSISVAAVANYATKKIKSSTQVVTEVPVTNIIQLESNPTKITSPPDSIQKKKEIVLIQDKDGKILSLTIDGVKVPQEELNKYEKFKLEDAVVGSAALGGNSTLKEKIIINKNDNINPKAPLKNKTPTSSGAVKIKGNPDASTGKSVQIESKSYAKQTVTVDGSSSKLTVTDPVTESQKVVSPNRNLNLKISGNGAEPIYILDGKPITKAEMNKVAPNTIEQIDVLKGSSAAKYGEAGKNGVVLITTKSGKNKSKTPENSTQVIIEEKSVTISNNSEERTSNSNSSSNNDSENSTNRDHENKTDKILEELKKDNLYSNDKNYTLKITNSAMFINQVKQPEALYRKYRKYLPFPDKNITNQTFEINGRFREK